MERAQRRGAARIMAAGDAAMLVRLSNRPGPRASQKVLALLAALDAAPPPGLVDIIPAYASVLVRFDPLVLDLNGMEAFLRAALARASGARKPSGRLIRIPVRYGGDNGPDLEEVARLLGLTTPELIQRHSAATYRVAFLGFLAGFPYLTGLPRALAVPRLATPRTRVPAGSVAIAERQAGVYSVESPGGWRILGRTDASLFDPNREQPSLLSPGDRVRFFPVAAGEQTAITPLTPKRATSDAAGVPWLRALQPGIQTTVQDNGRPGYARYGVPAAGAADPDALALGNALLANAPDAAGLEITGAHARFETLGPSIVAVTGAPCVVRVNERRIPEGVTFTLETGDTLELGAFAAGARAYLCVAGGVAAPLVMRSRATDLRARLGGLDGRSLRPGDVLRRGYDHDMIAGRTLPGDLARRLPLHGDWCLRILPGPHGTPPCAALESLPRARFTVDARSDRVGVRLRRFAGPCLEGGQVVSEGLPRGAVQLPPDGEPVLLLADAQTTGGYRAPAVVISADLWRIGQLRPGDTVCFQLVSPQAAQEALRRRAEAIERVARQPLPARLLAGFSEWSEEAVLAAPQRKGGDDGR